MACFAAYGGRKKRRDARITSPPDWVPRAPAGGLAALLHHLLSPPISGEVMYWQRRVLFFGERQTLGLLIASLP